MKKSQILQFKNTNLYLISQNIFILFKFISTHFSHEKKKSGYGEVNSILQQSMT